MYIIFAIKIQKKCSNLFIIKLHTIFTILKKWKMIITCQMTEQEEEVQLDKTFA